MPKATKARAKKQTILFGNSGWVVVCSKVSDIESLGFLKKLAVPFGVLPIIIQLYFANAHASILQPASIHARAAPG